MSNWRSAELRCVTDVPDVAAVKAFWASAMCVRTAFSWAAYPPTVLTRLGINAARRVSWTSMPPSASSTRTSAERSLL